MQDDTHVRMLTLWAEQRRADAAGGPLERRGMPTTGVVVQAEKQVLCLYRSGRAPAGDTRTALLARRAPGLEKPMVLSDALAATHRDDDDPLIRCHCLAHGRRQVTDLEAGFPAKARQGITVLDQVVAPAAVTHQQAMTPAERLAYHHAHRGPWLEPLPGWLDQQFQNRLVEPNSSLGKAFTYRLKPWPPLTQVLRVAGAPIGSHPGERALKLLIRQRKNSLFYASAHSATVASLLTSLIATGVPAGGNALD